MQPAIIRRCKVIRDEPTPAGGRRFTATVHDDRWTETRVRILNSGRLVIRTVVRR